jgi:hypothetical protein
MGPKHRTARSEVFLTQSTSSGGRCAAFGPYPITPTNWYGLFPLCRIYVHEPTRRKHMLRRMITTTQDQTLLSIRSLMMRMKMRATQTVTIVRQGRQQTVQVPSRPQTHWSRQLAHGILFQRCSVGLRCWIQHHMALSRRMC